MHNVLKQSKIIFKPKIKAYIHLLSILMFKVHSYSKFKYILYDVVIWSVHVEYVCITVPNVWLNCNAATSVFLYAYNTVLKKCRKPLEISTLFVNVASPANYYFFWCNKNNLFPGCEDKWIVPFPANSHSAMK